MPGTHQTVHETGKRNDSNKDHVSSPEKQHRNCDAPRRLVESYRFPTNRRLVFDINKGGQQPLVWNLNSAFTISVQNHLPIAEIGAIVAKIYVARPFPMKPNRLSMVTEQAAKAWIEAKDTV